MQREFTYKMRLTKRCISVNNEFYVEMYLRNLAGEQNKAYVGMCMF